MKSDVAFEQRMKPIFGELFRRDPAGRMWLPALLSPQSAPGSVSYETSGAIITKPEDAFLRKYPPPAGFLRWLALHPGRLTWPDDGMRRFAPEIQLAREEHIGDFGPTPWRARKAEAAAAIDRGETCDCEGKWWAYEGPATIHCAVETDSLLLFIRGALDKPPGDAGEWYPGRCEIFRDLDVALENAGQRNFAILLISDSPLERPSRAEAVRALHHLPPDEAVRFARERIGYLLWADVRKLLQER